MHAAAPESATGLIIRWLKPGRNSELPSPNHHVFRFQLLVFWMMVLLFFVGDRC